MRLFRRSKFLFNLYLQQSIPDIIEFPSLLKDMGSPLTALDVAFTRKFNKREKIKSYTPSTSQPPNPIHHYIFCFLQVPYPRGNNIRIHNCHHYLSIPQPPYPCFPLKNVILLPYTFLKPISFHHL